MSNEELNEVIIDTYIENPHLSFNEIAKMLNTNRMRVKRIIDKHNNQETE